MRAAVCTRWGPPEVLKVSEVAQPVPRKGQVRIRVVATSVTVSDCIARGLRAPRLYRIVGRLILGWRGPRRPIFGIVLSGVVDAVGRNVTSFKPGDEVFGMSIWKSGAYAEYVCWSAGTLLAPKPANLTHDEAVALPYGGLLAMHLVRKAAITPGQRVLVYGASGAIGTAMVQLAKHFGATVTGVCSTKNLALVESLGADAVIDYTSEDFTKGDSRYDVIVDAVGRRKSAQALAHAADVLAPGGKSISIDDDFPKYTLDDLMLLKRLAESGELKPVIDRTYRLDEIVDAHRYVEEGHKRGNVIVRL